jgi:hypothetical protein
VAFYIPSLLYWSCFSYHKNWRRLFEVEKQIVKTQRQSSCSVMYCRTSGHQKWYHSCMSTKAQKYRKNSSVYLTWL